MDTYLFLGAKPSEVAYLLGVLSGIQTQLNGKEATGSTITLTENQTLGDNITCTTNLKHVHVLQCATFRSEVGHPVLQTAAMDTHIFLLAKPSEVAYLLGVLSGIQPQLNEKQVTGSCISICDPNPTQRKATHEHLNHPSWSLDTDR